MESILSISAIRWTLSTFKSIWTQLGQLLLRKRAADVVVYHEQLPPGSVWDIGLRWKLTPERAEGVPSRDPSEQGVWLIADMGGTLFGTRGDRFQLYNRSQRQIEITSMRAVIVARRQVNYITEIRSPPAGIIEEDVLGADLSVGSDHLVREVRMECGDLEWDGLDFESRPKRVVLQAQELYSFQLFTTTGADSVEWRLEISYVDRSSAGKRSLSRSIVCPAMSSAPLITANQADNGEVEYWLTGVESLPRRPYLQRAILDEFDLRPENEPWDY
ncbi:hypothetical protein [Brachybacterium phenoliresistens]|uniref:hypothetical protein n=1 Tax=Brachybacterium phenoliresistens TaxID=396014 RepID=UPI0031D7DCC3